MQANLLPSFAGQLAVVFNDYMHTLGGGERSALAYARALMDLGFETEVLTRNEVPGRNRICETFGDEYDDVPIRKVSARQLYSYLKPAGIMVFVNHTFLSFEPNPAKIGFYSQMFPERTVRQYEHTREWSALQTYSALLCNSSFTKTYSIGRWDFPAEKNHVLLPPISSEIIQARDQYRRELPQKKKKFLNLGRFNPGVHNKNQKLIIEAFLDAHRRTNALQGWTLVLCGNRNSDPASEEYYRACVELAQNSNGLVELKANLSSSELHQLLKQSFGYVHGTGAFIPAGVSPEKCEHFGLAIAEAMAHGCIPLVYARGGIFDILDHQRGGIAYSNREQLINGFRMISSLYGTDEAISFQSKNLSDLDSVNRTYFTQRLLQYIVGELNS